MPLVIGEKLLSTTGNPLGLLGDCHRRIERFLDWLIAIAEQAQGEKLDDLQAPLFAVALRYFREAAPNHTRDEEESLFPRLRLKINDENRATMALLDGLHADHEEAEIKHRRVDELGRAWLTNEHLSAEDTLSLIALLKELRTTYEKHIAIEDNELFPLANKLLDRKELEGLAAEMADRRGFGRVE